MWLGGLIVGALAVFHPEVCGNGYSAVNTILRGEWLWQTLAVILVFKVLATARDVRLGRGRRRFHADAFRRSEPRLSLRRSARRHVPGHLLINPSAFALVGMGAFLAATTHAPIMAIIMIFELTLDYQIILPLMLACVVGYYTSVSIEKRSIYAEALKRKGAGDYRHQLAELHVRDLMKADPLTVSPTARFAEIGQKFIATSVQLSLRDGGRAFRRRDLAARHQELSELAGAGRAGDRRRYLARGFPIVHPDGTR